VSLLSQTHAHDRQTGSSATLTPGMNLSETKHRCMTRPQKVLTPRERSRVVRCPTPAPKKSLGSEGCRNATLCCTSRGADKTSFQPGVLSATDLQTLRSGQDFKSKRQG
jgi:hypothetical protein